MWQVIEQTDEEKTAMYMKMPKEDIVKMLIQCNKILNSRIPQVVQLNSCQHNFRQQDQCWQSCTHCGMIKPIGQ